MPNHVTNRIQFTGDQRRIEQIYEDIKNDKEGLGSIDFNKVIPMPEELNSDSTRMDYPNAISFYLTMVNPANPTLPGYDKIDDDEFNEQYTAVLNFAGSPLFFGRITDRLSDEELTELHNRPNFNLYELFMLGKDYTEKIIKYGAPDWWCWRNEHWDTKWNAYNFGLMAANYEDINTYDNTIEFDTAWSAPFPIYQKISENYPDVTLDCFWCEEFFGSNVGKATYSNGQQTSINYPDSDSKEAYELAAEFHDIGLEEMGYAYDESAGTYVYNEEDNEPVNVFLTNDGNMVCSVHLDLDRENKNKRQYSPELLKPTTNPFIHIE